MSAWRLHKMRSVAQGGGLNVAPEIRAAAGISPGPAYVLTRAIGPCVVFCQVDDCTDGALAEAVGKLKLAMEAWTKEP